MDSSERELGEIADDEPVVVVSAIEVIGSDPCKSRLGGDQLLVPFGSSLLRYSSNSPAKRVAPSRISASVLASGFGSPKVLRSAFASMSTARLLRVLDDKLAVDFVS